MPYFDHMATNPMAPGVLETMLPYLKEDFGNPLSLYPAGQKARKAVEEAREKVARLINAAKPQEIIFTASGAEANNMAIRGLAHANSQKGKHIIVSRMEHHSVLNAARILEKEGFTVTFLRVDKDGLVDPAEVKKAITAETVLVSVLHASPEVGTVEPVGEIARVAKSAGVIFHTDCVASAGTLPIDAQAMGADALSLSAHEFNGPKGAAALYLKGGTRIMPLIYGGIQEGGRRAGTEDVPAIAGMGMAAEWKMEELASGRPAELKAMRDKLIDAVLGGTKDVICTGHPEKRLPGHASFCVQFVEGEAMLLMLSAKKVYAASGSACSSRALKASPVLLSMGVPANTAQGSIVFSLGLGNTMEEIDYLVGEFPAVINRLREISPYARGWGETEEKAKCIPKS
jgi:cysteine desulfurase